MLKSSTPGTVVVAVALALFGVSCGASDTDDNGAPTSVATTAPAGQEAGDASPTADAGGSA
ncbi:hypothetical protein GT043_06905, partial [Streptomyces sp. SID2131]|nr:hypothetical protein [Streptomyces sp. SID2131]